MDIEYLLVLQNLRESLGDIVEKVMVGISYVGEGPVLVALVLILYWCVDKRLGQFAIASLAIGTLASQLAKNIACVYRPWVRDPRVIPAADALEGAGGYSFPSGHATGTVTSLGSIAWYVRKKRKLIVVLCALVMIAVIFSRNFLGVHTPQDVIVGTLVALMSIVIARQLMGWMERSDAMLPGHKRDLAVLLVVVAACVATLVVIEVKPYPMDYVDGKLLVDPETMKKGCFEAVGLLGGAAIGWFCERRIIEFDTGADISTAERVARGIVGVGIVGITYIATGALFKMLLPYNYAKLVSYLILTFIAVFVVPALFGIIHRICQRKS